MANDLVTSETSPDDARAIGETDYEPVGEDGDNATEEGNQEVGQGNSLEQSDSGRESTTSSSAEGNAGQDIQSSGDGVSEETDTFEAVSSEQFAEAIEAIDSKFDALNASTIVLVFALFLCAGILSVSTLVRSMEWR